MKILSRSNFRRGLFKTKRRNEEGLATIVFISLLAIMVMLVAANSMALVRLHKEVRFLEQQQVKRLNGTQTNSVPADLKINNVNQK